MYRALKGFHAREGHSRVPWAHEERGGARLGAWLRAQWAGSGRAA